MTSPKLNVVADFRVSEAVCAMADTFPKWLFPNVALFSGCTSFPGVPS